MKYFWRIWNFDNWGNECFLQITKDDALPKNICQRCIYKLEMLYDFHMSCITTDNILKNYADSIKQLAASVNNQVNI